MICAPISNRLKAKHEQEMIIKDLNMEGVLSIQSGENPKYIKEKLNSYVTYKEREAMNEVEGGESVKKKGKAKKSEAKNA